MTGSTQPVDLTSEWARSQGAEPLPPPPPPSRFRRAREAVAGTARRVWRRTPLLVRLVGISAVLLATGLSFAGLSTVTLLSSYLTNQVDERLLTDARSYASDLVARYNTAGSLAFLTTDQWTQLDYALDISIQGEQVNFDPSPSTVERYGTPDLPSLDLDSAEDRAGELFTISSSVRGASWRATIVPVTQEPTGEVVGWVMMAQPMGEADGIVRQASLLLWSSAAAILVIGVIVGSWAVRRSLRPLREIEQTAAAIAGGDMSRRVPQAPETTEVGRLGAALNSMLAQIEQAFDDRTASEERMRRFVADASHELRTPLAAIRGYGELYRMGALTEREQVDDTIHRIEQSATRMGGLVEDLLSLARMDADRPGRYEPVDLADLAADAAHDLRALDPDRVVGTGPLPGAATADQDDPAPTTVIGDEARLRQVLANLVGNVARHTPAGTPAEVVVGRFGDRVRLEVRDHGPGIAPEHAARVFERFYRVDPSRTRDGAGSGGGAGLGMAIVAAIVTQHGGTVGIQRTDGGGTTVRVDLPVTGPDGPDGDPEQG